MKPGDIVLNKRTNMIGRVASIDTDQARLEHEERTSWTKLVDLEPYDGPQQPGEELHEAKAAREHADTHPAGEAAPVHEGDPKAVH